MAHQTSRWLMRLAIIVFVVLLGLGALSHFSDGLTIDQALPVPSYMIAGRPLTQSAYLHAAAVLRTANPANGTSRIAGAEAALRSGAPGASQVVPLTDALTATPASARGWLLLAEVSAPSDRKRAAKALSEALLLGPNDYWLVGMRARLAARLLPDLDGDTQASARRQTRLMWEDPQLRDQLPALIASPGGLMLVRLAFAGDRDEFVALNRWVSAANRQAAEQSR